MAQFLKIWLPPVVSCLVLQGSLIGFGLAMDRWFNPEAPCCSQHLAL